MSNLKQRFFYANPDSTPATASSEQFARSLPVSNLIAMYLAENVNALVLSFEDSGTGDHLKVAIQLLANKGKESMEEVVRAINSGQSTMILGDQQTKESIISHVNWSGVGITISQGTPGTFALDGKLTVAGDTTLSGKFAGHRRLVIRQADFVSNARTLTVAESGALVLLDTQAATVVTLPAITASDIGVTYTITQTIASNDDRVVNTAYDNDYYTGAVVLLPAATWQPDTVQDSLDMFSRTAGDSKQITFDDDLQNGAGNVGSSITVTAILAGNVEAGGGSKHVWSVTGAMATADPNSSGGSVFS